MSSTPKELTSSSPALDLYLRITKSLNGHDYSCYWYKLDFERQKPVWMDWQSQYLHNSSAVVLKSDIYLLGGTSYFCKTDQNYYSYNRESVYRIDTSATPNPPCFESAPSMLMQRTTTYDSCTVLGDKIYIFTTIRKPNCMEIFDPSLDKWIGFSKLELHFPRELEGIAVGRRPLVPDHENNRVLIQFGGKGLYAFYPDTLKWERQRLCPKKQRDIFESSVIMNNVIYYCWTGLDDGKELIGALDVSDGCKPLKIVWPSGFEYLFSGKARCVSVLDLGNDKLCLVVQFHKCLDGESDDQYYYCYEEDEDVDLCAFGEMNTYMLVVSCLILELEKQPLPPPQPNCGRGLRQRNELLVKTASRFDFEFGNLVSSSDQHVQVQNAVAVLK